MSSRHLYEEARCSYFSSGICSSCSLLGLEGSERISRKESLIQNALAAHAISPKTIEPIRIPSAPWGSRCKIKMSVTGTLEDPSLGIVRSDLSSADLCSCPLTPLHMQDLLGTLKGVIKDAKLHPYDIKARTGELKHIIVMSNHDAREGIVRFILRSTESVPRIKKLVGSLQKQHPWVKVVSCNIQPIPAALIEGDEEHVLTTERSIDVRYNSIILSFLPQSFMQVTHEIAEALYLRAAQYVRSRTFSRVLDLYCGVGGFSLSVADSVKAITGVELAPMAVESARYSAQRLGISHATFHSADVEKFLESQTELLPDLVIVNPPRRGLSHQVCEQLLRCAPESILYSSCSPETFARDVAHLSVSYDLTVLAPFDMFAMTEHCEVLGILEKKR